MPEISESKYMVQAGWSDVPHLDKTTLKEILASTPPFLRDARSKGIPSLGAGAIYPIPLSEILEKAFEIPPYWPRVYALDVGWERTAVLWGALEQEADCWHFYTEHYRGQAEPSVHAAAIRVRGEWIPGLIDPAARGRAQKDGERLMVTYQQQGLKLAKAQNAVEAGLYDTWLRLSTGRIKVFETLRQFQNEYRLYRRDENGAVVKEHDHLMDAMRYIVLSGRSRAMVKPAPGTKISTPVGGDPGLGW